MVRALLLALALLLAACPARAGIVPSFVTSGTTIFQDGCLPDSQFAGLQEASICSLTTGVRDSTNWGGSAILNLGCTVNRKQKAIVTFTPGAYIPATFQITRALYILKAATSVADSIFGAVLLPGTYVLGSGVGSPVQSIQDTTNVSWRWRWKTSNSDTIRWNKPGADSSRLFTATFHNPVGGAAGGTAWTATTPEEKAAAGLLTYNSTQDRSPWQFVGVAKGAGANTLDTLNLTPLLRFVRNDSRATADYGIILRSAYSDTIVASHSNGWKSSEDTDPGSRPKLVVDWINTAPVIQIGSGQ